MKNPKNRSAGVIPGVRCGNGNLLTKRYTMGFTNLTGIDPSVNESRDYGRIKIFKKEIHDLNVALTYYDTHQSLDSSLLS